MDRPHSDAEFLRTTSKYADLLTIAKIKLEHLEAAVDHADEKNPWEKCDASEKGKSISKRKGKGRINWETNTWMKDLKKRLLELEYSGRAASVRTFFYVHNYLHVLRAPIRPQVEYQYKLPVCEIVFPEVKDQHLVPVNYKQGQKCSKRTPECCKNF